MRKLLLSALCFLFSQSTWATCILDPKLILCNGVYKNTNNGQITVGNATYSWTGAGAGCAGAQTDFEIDVGTADFGNIYGSASGTTATSVGSISANLGDFDRGSDYVDVRVRVKYDSDPGVFGPYARTRCFFQLTPDFPTSVAIASSGGSGTAETTFPAAAAASAGSPFYADAGCSGACAAQTGTPNSGSSCNSACTDSTPCSLVCAISKPAAGKPDVVTAHCGTYTTTNIQTTVAGDATNRITVQSLTPGCAILDNSASTSALLELKNNYWTVKDFKLRQANSCAANDSACAVIRGLGPTAATAPVGVLMQNLTLAADSHLSATYVGFFNCKDCIVENSNFTGPGIDIIEIEATGSSARNSSIVIRNNTFTADPNDTSYHAIVHQHGRGGPLWFEGNRVTGYATTEGVLTLYLGSEGATIYRNTFRNITTTGGGLGAIANFRSGRVRIYNNSFWNVAGAGITIGQRARFDDIQGNIFAKVTRGIERGDSTPNFSYGSFAGMKVKYNIFCENSGGSIVYPNAAFSAFAARFAEIDNNCEDTATVCASSTTCNPAYMDPNSGDLNIQASSAGYEMGPPSFPVPVDGGSRVDIGALEAGVLTGPMYTSYQSQATTTDTTPLVSWIFNHAGNALHTLFPGIFPHTWVDAVQTNYRLEVDTTWTFNSTNGHPLISTSPTESLIASGTASRHLGTTLAAGKYYVRMRYTDAVNTSYEGPWPLPYVFTVQ